MPRYRLPHRIVFAFLALLGLALPSWAGTLPADALPLPNRVATADVVVAGKVTSVEDKPVMAVPFPGAREKIEYRIAVVTLSDALLAPKDAKTIRLGFVPVPPMVAINPPPFQATVGQEGCFFLTKNADGDFYTASGGLSFLDKKNPNFAQDLALVKRCCKILQEPDAALKAKNAEERFTAAAMLLARYRTRKSAAPKSELIDAAGRLRERAREVRVVVVHERRELTEPLEAEVERAGASGWARVQTGDLHGSLARARCALSVSGTVLLDLLHHRLPAVVVYRLGQARSTWAYRRFLTVPWFSSVNLLAAREVYPEFCFHGEGPTEAVDSALWRCFTDEAWRGECSALLDLAADRLGLPGASLRAAAQVLDLALSRLPREPRDPGEKKP
jgi:hypothetical protein